MKKWLLPTVFITSQRLRTIIPMALWILAGVPSDTLLHDYSSLPSARLLKLCVFPHGGTGIWASSYNYTATQSESDEPKKPFHAKVRAPAKTIPVRKSTMPSPGCFSPPLNGVVFPKRGSHYARNRIRLDGLGGRQKQHVCLNKSKAERGFTSLSSFHWNSKIEAHNQPIK